MNNPIIERSQNLEKPNLFLFTETKLLNPLNEKAAQSLDDNSVPVYLKIVEINLLKIYLKKNDSKDQSSELSEYKREYTFKVPKEDIAKCKILKNNYLPEDNIIDMALPMNLNLYTPSFETIHQVIFSQIPNNNNKTPAIKIDDGNYMEIFASACCLELEELAMRVYEEKIKSRLNLRLLVDILLLALEYSLPQASAKFYQMFREYWVCREGFSDKTFGITEKILKGKDGASVLFENEMFNVYEKMNVVFSFSPNVFKKIFETVKKQRHEEYLKPEMRYHVLKVHRNRNNKGDDAYIWDSPYPHRFSMVYDHKAETILTAIRETEYGKMFLFGNEAGNEVIYGQNYVGCIEPNAWGTIFDVYDDGMEESLLASLPKFFFSPRRKIGNIAYDTNIMGEVPRSFKIAFFDFLDKMPRQIESVKPNYDYKNDCYTLNFYGRVKRASARNFILQDPEDPDSVMFMHGKVSKDCFNLDYRHPLNFVQAFSISLVSIGKKFCVA